jgi:hypothetical protein
LRDDLKGKKFDRLLVLERACNSQANKVQYRCLCDCGNETIVSATHLKSGHTTSCGCKHKEIFTQMVSQDLVGKVYGKLTVIDKNNELSSDGN